MKNANRGQNKEHAISEIFKPGEPCGEARRGSYGCQKLRECPQNSPSNLLNYFCNCLFDILDGQIKYYKYLLIATFIVCMFFMFLAIHSSSFTLLICLLLCYLMNYISKIFYVSYIHIWLLNIKPNGNKLIAHITYFYLYFFPIIGFIYFSYRYLEIFFIFNQQNFEKKRKHLTLNLVYVATTVLLLWVFKIESAFILSVATLQLVQSFLNKLEFVITQFFLVFLTLIAFPVVVLISSNGIAVQYSYLILYFQYYLVNCLHSCVVYIDYIKKKENIT